ncbi:MAG: hypothetical protein ACPGR7_08065 [Flavobacteriaceae bacterium]
MTLKPKYFFVPSFLLIPLIAMQFINEVNWDAGDFVIAAILLGSAQLALSYAQKKIVNKKKRRALILIILLILLVIWAELSVGVFGSPLAGS